MDQSPVILANWSIPVKKSNGNLRNFKMWKVPAPIVELHGLTSVETYLIDIKLGKERTKRRIVKDRFRLISRFEISLNRENSTKIEAGALADSSSNVYFEIEIPKTAAAVQSEFEARVTHAAALNEDELKRRAYNGPKFPSLRQVSTTVFIRNAEVVRLVLLNAKGRCGLCNDKAPFLKAKDQEPYLEVHHKITLANGGEDTPKNAIALCPNCHRKQHHGIPDKYPA